MKKLSAVFLLTFFCCKLFAQSNIPSYVPTNGLVAYYPFNGNANDESGNGNNGTVNGATLTIDRFGNSGKAFSFDGYNNISIPHNTRLNILGDLTISAWFLSEGPPNFRNSHTIITKRSSNDMNNIPYALGINYQYGIWTDYKKPIFVTASYYYAYYQSSFDITNWQWNHLVSVINGTNLKLYLNDTLVLESIIDAEKRASNTSDVLIGSGGRSDLPAEQFLGKLDDITIYNRALTQQEITALYTGQSTSNTNTDSTSNTTKPVPPGIPYQAVIRNASGQIMTNANVKAQFTLHKDSAIGGVEYQEVHSLTTNGHGLINTVLGKGTATQGTFAGINWANTNKFLQVQMDLGNGYVDLGTQQLMSVPYAMYAANGPKGEKGEVGPQGIQGAKGDAGEQGPQGYLQSGSALGNTSYWNGSSWVTNNSNIYNNGSAVGINTSSPHPSAALDISDTARGILIPRMTMNQRNAIQNPAEGLMVYQTDSTKGSWYWNGNEWNNIGHVPNGTNIGDILSWNGTSWISTSLKSNLPTVITELVHDIWTDSAMCSGSITSDGGYSVTSKGICWSLHPNPTINDFHSNEGPGALIFNSSLYGLQPDTTYYYRAYATNSEGTSYGISFVFNTLSFFINTSQTPNQTVPLGKHWKIGKIIIPVTLNHSYIDNTCWPSGPSYGCSFCGINYQFARLGYTSLSKQDGIIRSGYSDWGCGTLSRTMTFSQSDVNIPLPIVLNPGEIISGEPGILVGIEEY